MRPPVPIVWVSCVGEKGGAESLMIECLRVLDRSRFQPHVIQLRPGRLQQMLEDIGVPVHVLSEHRMREVHHVAEAIGQIRGIVRRNRIALIHSNGFRAHVYGGLAAAWAGVPEVWTTHTVELPTLATSAILSIPTDCVVANCPRTAAFFRSRVAAPVEMIWPGVNREVLERATPRLSLAETYRLPAAARWISIGGRLQKYKGQMEFLRALASLPRDSNVHGIIIGGTLFGQESEYQRELRLLAAELKVTDRVTFTGFVPDADVAGLFGQSYVTLHPAHDEDFGLAVAEAQILGVPCIAFSAVGPAAIILDGETGWLVPVGDQPGLNRALAEALADPKEVSRRGMRAQMSCSDRFGVQEHVRKTMECYDRALSRP